ncbi:MAG: hypothetical protein Q4G07_03525 [Oscillospiraceae bacterium]|nr:hypothetical protein [Oscillospiraceae bacterium]
MFAKAKKKSMMHAAIWSVCLLVLAAVMLFATGFGVFKLLGGPKNIHRMTADEMPGAYVEADLDWLVDYYAYTKRNSKTVEREYIFGTDRNIFMGVACRGDVMEKAQDLMEECQAYIDGETDRITKNFVVTGTIVEMDAESKRFFKDYFRDVDTSGIDLLNGYYLQVNWLGNMHQDATWMLTIGALACIIIALFMFIRAAMGSGQKKLLAYCAKSENPEATRERLEQFWQETPVIGKLRMNEEWMIYEEGAKQKLLETPHIIWAYQSTTQHRTNGIKTGKTYALMLCDDQGKTTALGASEKEVQEMLAYMDEHFPHIVLGYKQELDHLYRSDRARFRQLRQEAPAPAAVSAPVAEPAAPTEDTIDRDMFD